jgi:integrase/recombinase XerD
MSEQSNQQTAARLIEKLTLDKITKETILQFLDWIQKERKCSGATRNSRLAAIHSFYKYLQLESLEHMHESQKILSIKFKNAPKETMNYLTIDSSLKQMHCL